MIQRAQDAPRRRRHPPPALGPWLTLLGVAVALRALVAWAVPSLPEPDPRLGEMAQNLASGHGLAVGPAAAPTAAFSPAAPLLLAAALRATHDHPLAPIALTIVLGAFAALAAARLASGLHGPTAGRAAGWTVALSPMLARGGGALAAATFALSMLLALTAGAEWLRTPRRARSLVAGLLCGLATLAGGAGVLLAPLLLAWSWRPLGLTLPPRERLAQSALLALGFAAVVAPWVIRNSVVLRAPVALTTSAGTALWSGNNATVWDDPARRGGAVDVLTVEPYASRLRGAAEPERDRLAFALAAAFLRSRPLREHAAVTAARLERLWSAGPRPDDPADDARHPPGIPARALAAAEIVWLLLAAWGALRTLSGPRRWFQSLPLVALLALAAAALPFSGSSRARLGFEPLVGMLAGIGVLSARRTLHLRRRGMRLVTGGAGRGHGARGA